MLLEGGRYHKDKNGDEQQQKMPNGYTFFKTQKRKISLLVPHHRNGLGGGGDDGR
jgi:hypothetical protein